MAQKEINQPQFYASYKTVWAHFSPNSVFSDLTGNLKSIMVESTLELFRFNKFIVLHVKEHEKPNIKMFFDYLYEKQFQHLQIN